MNTMQCIKISENDNVAIATCDLPTGTKALPDLITKEAVPQGHKVALTDIEMGAKIVRYGVTLGYATERIFKGEWIHEDRIELPAPPALDTMEFATNLQPLLEASAPVFWEGYHNPYGTYGGTRNILAISTTVQCVTGVVNKAVEKMKTELLPRYSNVDDIVAINHAYGCGVAINVTDAHIPIRSLNNLMRHPNFGGELMLVGLGCEKLTPEMLLSPEENNPENVIILQEVQGYEAMIDALMSMAEKKLARLSERKREKLPLSALLVGMQCGGSDAFSGITANPGAGYAADLLVAGGASVIFSEVTEVRDGVHLLAERCVDKEVGKKLASEIQWYDDYLTRGGADRSANPTPGNKKGGLSNIVEKAMGSIAKSGTSPIVEVLSPGEMPTKQGLIYGATPASDIVCGPCQLASGIGLQVFMTGRGTPYGLATVPVIKVGTRTELHDQWPDLIDINAGTIISGETTIQDVGKQLFDEIIQVASGKKKSCAEQLQLYNDFCIFNPAPIT